MTTQLNLFSNPPYQRHSRTSKAASKGMETKAPSLRAQVLMVIRCADVKGMTDEEIQQTLGINGSTERPRRVELLKAKCIMDSGMTRLTTTGRKAVVWRST